jgi:hypothetical protein
MARNPIIREHPPTIPVPTGERPHGCIAGVVYIGHLVEAEDGEEVEVFETVPCRRCKPRLDSR